MGDTRNDPRQHPVRREPYSPLPVSRLTDPVEPNETAGWTDDSKLPSDSLDEQPQPNPANAAPELMPLHDTNQLARWHRNLRQFSPSDPTFVTTLAAAVRALLEREMAHPDRRNRDEQAAQERQAAADAERERQEQAAVDEAAASGAPGHEPTTQPHAASRLDRSLDPRAPQRRDEPDYGQLPPDPTGERDHSTA